MALGLTVGDTVTVCIGVGAVVRVWEEEEERTVRGKRDGMCVCVRERERELIIQSMYGRHIHMHKQLHTH